jgi:hypothetical protein
MATRRKPVSEVIAQDFESRGIRKETSPPIQENMKTRTFQMKDSEYEALRKHFSEEMGMKIGQGIRYALHKYLKEYLE